MLTEPPSEERRDTDNHEDQPAASGISPVVKPEEPTTDQPLAEEQPMQVDPQLESPSATTPAGPNYKLQLTLSGHTLSVSSLKFSPDGNKLASACTQRCFPSSDHV